MDDYMRRHRELNPHIYNPNHPDYPGHTTVEMPRFTVEIINIDGELGFIIPDEIAKQNNLKEGQDIEIEVDEGIMRIYFV